LVFLFHTLIGHTLRKPKHNITRQALQWNPQGKCGRGRPRNTWRRDFIAEMEIEGKIWNVWHKAEQGGGLSSLAYAPPRYKRRKQK
jgi:hypothetical protein